MKEDVLNQALVVTKHCNKCYCRVSKPNDSIPGYKLFKKEAQILVFHPHSCAAEWNKHKKFSCHSILLLPQKVLFAHKALLACPLCSATVQYTNDEYQYLTLA